MSISPSHLEAARQVPGVLAATLTRLIHRARAVIVLRGVAATLVVAIGAVLIVMGIDAGVTLFSAAARWALSLLVYAATGAAGVAFLIHPLARSFTLEGAARLLESRHPELQERISSTVELLTSRDGPEVRGSDALIAALAEEAVHDAQRIPVQAEVPLRVARPALIGVLAVGAILLGLLSVRPRQTVFLLARATAPFLNLPNLSAEGLEVEPGDVLVPDGASLQITLRARHGTVPWARLRVARAEARETEVAMMPLPGEVGGRAYVVRLPQLTRSFRYRIQAGDALTRYYTVRVAPPPQIQRRTLAVRPPAYTGLPEWRETNGPGVVRAVAGSKVTVDALLNKRVSLAELHILTNGITNTVSGELRASSEGPVYTFSFPLPPGLEGAWSLRFRDELGLSNVPTLHAIHSLPDRPPTVAIANLPQREIRLRRGEALPVRYVAADDLGLSAVSLTLQLGASTQTIHRPLLAPAQGGMRPSTSAEGETLLDLASPLFASAPRVTFRVRAADTLPAGAGGPQVTETEPYVVVFDAQAEPWAQQIAERQQRRIQETLAAVDKLLAQAEQQADALRPALSEPSLKAAGQRLAEAVQTSLAAAEQDLRELSRNLASGFYPALASNLSTVAQAHVQPAQIEAGRVPLLSEPEARLAANSNVLAHVREARAELAREREQLAPAAEALRRAVELDALARREEALARMRTETAPESSASPASPPSGSEPLPPEAWAQAQNRVADDLRAMAQRPADAPQPLAAGLSQRAAEAAQEASRLAQAQTALAQAIDPALKSQAQAASAWQDLAQRQSALAEETRPLNPTAAEAMRQAASALEASRPQDALPNQANAARGLQAQAAAQRAAEPGGDRPDGARQAAEALEQLAARQEALRQETQAWIARQEDTTAQLHAQLGAALAAEQQRLAEEAARLAEAMGRSVPAERPQAQASARHAAQAAETAAQQQWGAAATRAQQAAQSLNGLQQSLDRRARAPWPEGSGPTPEQAEAARWAEPAASLAQRQQQLAQQMAALAEGRPHAAAAAQQAAIEQAAGNLAEASRHLREDAAALPGATPVSQLASATQQLMEAGRRAAEAREALARGQQSSAPGTPVAAAPLDQAQRSAAGSLEAAAQSLAQAAEALRNLAASSESGGPEDTLPAVAAAYEAAREAARSGQASDAVEAAARTQEAARRAAEHARAMGVNPRPSEPAWALGGGGVRPEGSEEGVPFWMERLGLKLRDWLRLHGELGPNVQGAGDKPGPEEYRVLIERYFREISKLEGNRR